MKENKKPLALYQISSVPIMPMVLSILGKLGITVLVSVISSYVLSTTENKINDTPFWMNIGQYIKIGVCIICIGLLAYTIIHCIRKGTVTWWLNIIICALFVGAVIAGLPFDALYKLANRNTAILSGLGIVIGAIGSNASKPDKKQYWTIAILLCLAFCVITVTIQTVYTRVPGVVGKTVDEAETILLEKDIGIKLEKGEIISDTNREWIVTAQDPKKNSIHNKFFPVLLTVEEPVPHVSIDEIHTDDEKTPNIEEQEDEEVNITSLPTIPKYSELFEEKDTALEDITGRHLAYFGPSDKYAEAGGYETEKCSGIKVYYRINGFVLTSLYYNSVNQRRWVYLPEASIDSPVRKTIELTRKELSTQKGMINRTISPYWAPVNEIKEQNNTYVLNEGTSVNIFFTDEKGQFAFVEFAADKNGNEKARMWVPIESIDFSVE